MNSKSTIYANFNPLIQKAKQCLFALLLCSSFFSYAQRPYYNQRPEFLKANSVWAFGEYAGLDFNSGGPVQISTAIQCFEGSASVADPVTGKLLFYSNGGQVWNANHRVMPNGDSLLGNARVVGRTTANNFSTQQGVCIVPVIGDPDKYYLFSLRGQTSGGPLPEGTLFYNMVDMNLDNGLGDIVPGQKNIALDRGILHESIVTVPGNNCDIWLIVHEQHTHEFKAYHITKGGIDTTPVVSTISSGFDNYLVGIAISPDRSKIAVGAMLAPGRNPGGFTIAEFDPTTGHITNEIINDQSPNIMSLCFSPDNSKLYVGAFSTSPSAPSGLLQYDLTVYDSATIANSVAGIFSDVASSLKLYNDTIYAITNTSNTARAISRINQPNLSGSACDFQQDATIFDSVTVDTITVFVRTRVTLNNNVVLPLPPDTAHTLALDTYVCPAEFTLNALQGFEEYIWDDGSTSINRNITAPGTYWVLLKDYCHYRMDTFIISGMNLIPPVINIDIYTLGTAASYSSYQWMLNGSTIPGATDSTYTVSENGDYQVIVTNEMGCTDTSEIYLVNNVSITEDRFEIHEQIRIYPNPANSRLYIDAPFAVSIKLTDLAGKLVKKEIITKVMTVDELPNGIYLLNISNREGVLLKTEKLVKAE